MSTLPHHKPDRSGPLTHGQRAHALIEDARALIGRPFVTLLDEQCRRAANSAMATVAAGVVRQVLNAGGAIGPQHAQQVAIQGLRAINVNARAAFGSGHGITVPSDQWGKAYVG